MQEFGTVTNSEYLVAACMCICVLCSSCTSLPKKKFPCETVKLILAYLNRDICGQNISYFSSELLGSPHGASRFWPITRKLSDTTQGKSSTQTMLRTGYKNSQTRTARNCNSSQNTNLPIELRPDLRPWPRPSRLGSGLEPYQRANTNKPGSLSKLKSVLKNRAETMSKNWVRIRAKTWSKTRAETLTKTKNIWVWKEPSPEQRPEWRPEPKPEDLHQDQMTGTQAWVKSRAKSRMDIRAKTNKIWVRSEVKARTQA